MASLLSAQLAEFTDPRNAAQLRALESALASSSPTDLTQEDKAALLQLFERFPEEDGFGVFWTILHALEAADNYERELVASVRRAPNLFNTLMVSRIFNAGTSTVAGVPVEHLLREALNNKSTKATVAKQVQGFLDH